MATKPFRISLGGANGWGGVDQSLDPRRSNPNTLAYADGANLLEGDLRPFLLPGTPNGATSRAGGARFIPGAGGVTTSLEQMSLCFGPTNPAGAGAGTMSWLVSGDGAVLWSDGYGASSPFLGIPAPVISAAVNGASGGARRFRVTFRVVASGFDRPGRGVSKSEYYQYPAVYESNPNTYAVFAPGAGVTVSGLTNGPAAYIELSNFVGGTLTIDSPAALATPALSGMLWEVAIYATPIGNTSGPYLYYDRATFTPPAAVTTTAFTNPSGRETSLILAWDAYGSPGNQLFKDDFSPAPFNASTLASSLVVISDGLHTVADTTGAGQAGALPVAGILFGATANKLCWSRLGYPWQWPLANTSPIVNIQAIVNNGATTYVGTTLGWYVVTGTDDQALTISGPFGKDGVADQAGASATLTPFGVLFLGRRGMCLFDGNSTQLLHEINTHPANGYGSLSGIKYPQVYTNTNFACRFGIYSDDLYMADLGYGCTLIANLDSWPKVAVTYQNSASTRGIQPAYLAILSSQMGGTGTDVPPAVVTSYGDGFSGANSSATLVVWSPRKNLSGATSTEYMYMEARSQRIDLGQPGYRKKFKRAQVRASGGFTITFTAGRDVSTTVATHTTTVAGDQWLPAAFDWCDWIQVTITSGAIAGANTSPAYIESVDIDGVLYGNP